MKTVRSVALALLWGFGTLAAPTRMAEAQPDTGVTWFLDPQPADVGTLRFPCGDYGSFAIRKGLSGDVKPPKCGDNKATACGSEKVRVYPSPLFPGAKASGGTANEDGPWLPCLGRSCFTGIDDLQKGKPWVAVVDWNNLHGWSVGWTIGDLANGSGGEPIPVVFFDLYENLSSTLAPFSQLGATDVHVLRQLCRIAELSDAGLAPRVINMSFGRILQTGDAQSVGTCDKFTLSCQVARVLDHLACKGSGRCPAAPRTLAVAAAGNQPFDLMFPAALEEVTAAGSLQLGKFALDDSIEPSWETPDYRGKARALVPGYGLCLKNEDAREWPAPPGTSFASAVFSGWLAGTLSDRAVEAPFSDQLWFPRVKRDGGTTTYLLTHKEFDSGSNPRVDALFRRILDPALHACEGFPADPEAVQSAVLQKFESLDRLAHYKSFNEVLDELTQKSYGPAPPDRPCVSCVRTESASPPLDRAAAVKASPTRLAIDMTASARGSEILEGFPDLESLPEIRRLRVYLRVGERLARIGVGQDLAAVSAGTASLVLDKGLELPPEEQPSLIYFYQWGNLKFWTSVPILLRSH